MTKNDLVSALFLLFNNFGETPNEDLLRMWVDLLREDKFTAAEVMAGVKTLLRENIYKTRPPFAVLRDAIVKVTGRTNGRILTVDEKLRLVAESEWNLALAENAKFGGGQIGKLNPVTRSVLGPDGFGAIRRFAEDALVFEKKRFIDRWVLQAKLGPDAYDGADSMVRALTGRGTAFAEDATGIGVGMSAGRPKLLQ